MTTNHNEVSRICTGKRTFRVGFRIYLVLLIIGILVPVCYTDDSACPANPIQKQQLSDFEFDLFRWAPTVNATPCQHLRAKLQEKANPALASSCPLEEDCRRVKRALACYNLFYPNLQDAEQAKIDLDENDVNALAVACKDYL